MCSESCSICKFSENIGYDYDVYECTLKSCIYDNEFKPMNSTKEENIKKNKHMTIEETKKAAQAMLDWAEGKEIQFRPRGSNNDSWDTFIGKEDIDWDLTYWEFRTKPGLHYRPFENADEVMEAIKEHGDWLHGTNTDCIGYFKLLAVTTRGIDTTACEPSFHFAYDMFTFTDGTPFGKLVEE